MTTATETFTSQNIENEGGNQGGDMNFSANNGGMDLNLGNSGAILQNSVPMGAGFEAGTSTAMSGLQTTTTQQFTSTTGGTVMGIGGGVGDSAQDVTYSTKSNQGFGFGTGGAGQTTTTTTTQYGF